MTDTAKLGRPVPGWVHLVSQDPYQILVARLGDQDPQITSGYGGWDTLARARRRSLPVFSGQEPYRLSFNIVLDAFAENVSVEAEIRKLERMAIPAHSGRPPTKLKVYGYMPMDNTRNAGALWVIDSLEWTDSLRSKVGQVRTRQGANIVLAAIPPDSSLKIVRSPRLPGARIKRYKVRKGDTLQKIAAKYLGTSRRWKEIATLNKIRDPSRLKTGSIIKLP